MPPALRSCAEVFATTRQQCGLNGRRAASFEIAAAATQPVCCRRCRLMSALGQKQTFAAQNGMSALPPIATLIAFFCMSVGPIRTSVSFDHLGQNAVSG
jgi:hypothetical protein